MKKILDFLSTIARFFFALSVALSVAEITLITILPKIHSGLIQLAQGWPLFLSLAAAFGLLVYAHHKLTRRG